MLGLGSARIDVYSTPSIPSRVSLVSRLVHIYELAPSLRANSLGLLVRVEAVRLLELLDESNVPLLGLLGGDALVDELLPGALLRLALYSEAALVSFSSRICDGGLGGWTDLEVEHSGGGSLADVLAVADLVEACGGITG